MPLVFADVAASVLAALVGVLVAWVMRRRSTLSIQNLYLAAVIGVGAITAAASTAQWLAVMVLAPVAAVPAGGSAVGRRWRLSDLGAGEELRNLELARRWIWEPAPVRRPGEKVYIRSQGEVIRERPWEESTRFVSMTEQGQKGARLPIGAGQHIFVVGGSGTGKTTTIRRVVTARVKGDGAALFVIDQKGDPADVEEMRNLAAAAGRAFILFDVEDPATDHWSPLWGTPESVAARCLEPIQASEPYYYDVLRVHLDVICKVLEASDRWVPSLPYLIDLCQPANYATVLAMAEQVMEHAQGSASEQVGGVRTAQLVRIARRAEAHASYVSSLQGIKDLEGGHKRLSAGLSIPAERVITPRSTPEGEAVAVNLVQAMQQRAVVMWRTHVDKMPDAAAAITLLALTDIYDAAGHTKIPWCVLLDEFGGVLETASKKALAVLQRGRSHGGQIFVITQSTADPESATQQTGLLSSLTDNFTGFVVHRQNSPDVRDWLAKLMGTRALWQNTSQTGGHGSVHSGQGSARRVREFRIGSDEFARLNRGRAVIYTPDAGEPVIADIKPIRLPHGDPKRIDQDGPRDACEFALWPELDVAALSIKSGRGRSHSPDDQVDEIDPDSLI